MEPAENIQDAHRAVHRCGSDLEQCIVHVGQVDPYGSVAHSMSAMV